MAAFLPAMQIAGTVISVVGALSQGQAQADASRYNQAQAQRNATVATQQGAADEARQRRKNAAQMGSLRAGIGASGVTIDGSPLDFLEAIATEGELHAQEIRYGAQLKAMGLRETASLDGAAADNALTAGRFKASGELLAGGAKGYGAFNGLRPKAESTYDAGDSWY